MRLVVWRMHSNYQAQRSQIGQADLAFINQNLHIITNTVSKYEKLYTDKLLKTTFASSCVNMCELLVENKMLCYRIWNKFLKHAYFHFTFKYASIHSIWKHNAFAKSWYWYTMVIFLISNKQYLDIQDSIMFYSKLQTQTETAMVMWVKTLLFWRDKTTLDKMSQFIKNVFLLKWSYIFRRHIKIVLHFVKLLSV